MTKKYNKYRYFKVNPEMKKEMIWMRKRGKTYAEIGEFLGVSGQTARYYLDKKCNKYTKKKASKRKQPKGYMTKYISNRYHNDPEFRNRMNDDNKRLGNKRYHLLKKMGLCVDCGGKRDGKLVYCSKCRERRRK